MGWPSPEVSSCRMADAAAVRHPSFSDWECDRNAPNHKRHMPLQNYHWLPMQLSMWWVHFLAHQWCLVSPIPPGPSGRGAVQSPRLVRASVLNRQTSVSSASSLYTPFALWLSHRYTSALETLHLNSDPHSPSDSLISYSVERRTTKLTQLMPCDRPSVRDRRGDCQRLLNTARRDARNAVLREPDSALLPGPSPIGAARGVDGGTRGACRRPLPGPAVCFKLFAPVHGRAGSGLCDKPAALAASYL